MAIFGPTKEELVSELATILKLEGEKIPASDQYERDDIRLAAILKNEHVSTVIETEYHGDGINIYGYRIVGEDDIHPCLAKERIRVILDDGTGVALDSSVNPKDLLFYRKGRWARKAHDLYIAINYK